MLVGVDAVMRDSRKCRYDVVFCVFKYQSLGALPSDNTRVLGTFKAIASIYRAFLLNQLTMMYHHAPESRRLNGTRERRDHRQQHKYDCAGLAP